MRKPLILTLIACTLLLSACGKTSNNSKDTAAVNAGTQTAPTGQTAADNTESRLDKIKKSGKLVIGTTGNFRPFTYIDSNNQLVGYDIEWGNLIAKELGVKAEFVTGQFAGLIPGLVAEKFDIIMSGVSMIEERKKSIDYSETYAMDGMVAVVKKGSKAVKDINDLKDKVVGVNSGSAFQAQVKTIGGYKEMKEYPGAAESFADLKVGRIDVVGIGIIAATDYIKNAPIGSEIEIVGQPYKLQPLGLALPKGDVKLKKEIDRIINDKKQDLTYDTLSQKYLGVILK
jgi:ABC-type amino acid transport substrate-binding protein